MKKCIVVPFLIIFLAFGNAFAYNFKCLSRNGWSPGNGRYSYQGEWIDYFGVHAKAGEDLQGTLSENKRMRVLTETILTVEAKSVRYTPEYEFKKESQIVTQNVDSTSTDKNSFIVKFEKAFYSDIPKIYSTITSTSFISCTAIDDNKSLKCIPDSNTMIDGNSYKIVYQKACDGDKVETGITVNYSNSNYMKYTGIFIILGLFL